jgi:hypothetical protein
MPLRFLISNNYTSSHSEQPLDFPHSPPSSLRLRPIQYNATQRNPMQWVVRSSVASPRVQAPHPGPHLGISLPRLRRFERPPILLSVNVTPVLAYIYIFARISPSYSCMANLPLNLLLSLDSGSN